MAMTATDVPAAEVDRLAADSGASAAEIREAIGVAMPVTARRVERRGSLHRSFEAVLVVDAVLLLLRLRHDHLEGGLKGGAGEGCTRKTAAREQLRKDARKSSPAKSTV